MARKLYVGNLPYDTDEQALQTLFASAGTVETVSVMRDMATGRARGFAFVEMASDEDAQKAISMLNDQGLRGTEPDGQRSAAEAPGRRRRRSRRRRLRRRWRRQQPPLRAALVNGEVPTANG